MPTNVFFSPKVNTEQYMFEDIIIESIKMYGQDVFYMPRKIVQRDLILGEDIESEFNTANTVEMFIENTEGFEGEGNIFQKFGMEIRDEATFIVAKRSWQKLVGIWNSDINDDRPFEGDLIYLPLSKSFFEISYVEHEQPFYQLSNLPVFKLQARLFEFNDEEFNTGIAEVDSIENNYGYQEIFYYGSSSGTFTFGERIKHIITAERTGSAVATAVMNQVSGRGDVSSVSLTQSGFGYSSIPSVIFDAQPGTDFRTSGSLGNGLIQNDVSKFNGSSIYLDDSTKYANAAFNAPRTEGAFEFFFKTKSSLAYNGQIAIFGDFNVVLDNNQVQAHYKTNTASVAYVASDWNHLKVSVKLISGNNYQVQIYINGTRLYNFTESNSVPIIIGAAGHHHNEQAAKFFGLNSSSNTDATNGLYIDSFALNSFGIADASTITVPSSTPPSADVYYETFAPITPIGSAVINAAGEVTSINITENGRFYAAAPNIVIGTSGSPDTAEINMSAQLVSHDNTSMTINQIETSDGEYHAIAVGQLYTGVDSGATCTVTQIFDVATSATDSTFTTDLAARNFNYEDEADDIIDFSESNPFGDAT